MPLRLSGSRLQQVDAVEQRCLVVCEEAAQRFPSFDGIVRSRL